MMSTVAPPDMPAAENPLPESLEMEIRAWAEDPPENHSHLGTEIT